MVSVCVGFLCFLVLYVCLFFGRSGFRVLDLGIFDVVLLR